VTTKIETGIKSLDELIDGGLPESTVTILYGPPKTGKSIFCAQFLNQGLINNEPILYVLVDYDSKQLVDMMKSLKFVISEQLQKGMVSIVELCPSIGSTTPPEIPAFKAASIKNPTDIMVNIGEALKTLSLTCSRFRVIVDSATTLFTYNNPILIVRIIKAIVTSIKQAGGTGLITYTEGVIDMKIETMLKSAVDNIIKLYGDKIDIEAMAGVGRKEAKFSIMEGGIVLKEA